jgi:hypothetical protein
MSQPLSKRGFFGEQRKGDNLRKLSLTPLSPIDAIPKEHTVNRVHAAIHCLKRYFITEKSFHNYRFYQEGYLRGKAFSRDKADI